MELQGSVDLGQKGSLPRAIQSIVYSAYTGNGLNSIQQLLYSGNCSAYNNCTHTATIENHNTCICMHAHTKA